MVKVATFNECGEICGGFPEKDNSEKLDTDQLTIGLIVSYNYST